MLYSIVEHGEDPTLEELSDHLFGAGRMATTERLLAAAQRWDLVYESDGQWSLTDLGADALRQRSILVPRDSVWSALFLDAGGVGVSLVTLEEVATARLQLAKDENISTKAKQEAGHALVPFVGAPTLPADGGAEAFIQEHPAPTGVLLAESWIDVTWYPLAGEMQFGEKDWTSKAASCEVGELIAAIRPDLLSAWDVDADALSVKASELDIDELFSRRLTIEGSSIRIDPAVNVDHAELSLPCQPANRDDASVWVVRRAATLATQLQTDNVWEETLRTAAADLDDYDPTPPTKIMVADRAKSDGDLTGFWNLIAADDWRL